MEAWPCHRLIKGTWACFLCCKMGLIILSPPISTGFSGRSTPELSFRTDWGPKCHALCQKLETKHRWERQLLSLKGFYCLERQRLAGQQIDTLRCYYPTDRAENSCSEYGAKERVLLTGELKAHSVRAECWKCSFKDTHLPLKTALGCKPQTLTYCGFFSLSSKYFLFYPVTLLSTDYWEIL